MNDLISRKDAIEAVSKGCQELRGVFSRCEENILALPSVQPEQKHGKWEVKHIGDFRFIVYCSACGAWRTLGVMKYCPNRGAEMEE